MSNFLSDVWKTIKGVAEHPINEAQWWEDVITGDVSLKDAPGTHQDMMHDTITKHLGGDSKLAKNSDAVAATIVGGILAAPLVGGATGGSAGGTAGTAGSTGTSTGLMGSLQNGWNASSNWLSSQWDKLGTSNLTDEQLGALADAESTAEFDQLLKGFEGKGFLKTALETAGNIGKMGQQSQPQQRGGGAVRTGGGTNIQTEDQYAAAMKALTEKYGNFMFNKNF